MKYFNKKLLAAASMAAIMAMTSACGEAKVPRAGAETNVVAAAGVPLTKESTSRDVVARQTQEVSATTEQEQEQERMAQFGSFAGTIREIRPFFDEEGNQVEGKNFVLVEDEEGGQMTFVVTKDSVYLQQGELEMGERITGWYDATLPVLMIYPPQHHAQVILLGQLDGGASVYVDRFDEGMASYDGELVLNLSEDTQIVLPSGKSFEGDLRDRKLAVIYSFVTASIPGQTTPEKIVLLQEDEDDPYGFGPAAMLGENPEYVIEGEILMAAEPYIGVNGALMLPLEDIAKALDYTVTYDKATKTMTVGTAVSVTIGQNCYSAESTASIELESAPELVEGQVYVPISFFRKVLSVNNAYVSEGQIVIDNGEKML